MKLSISNIAWSAEHDDEILPLLKIKGYEGIEIAPTRIFPDNPYDNILKARIFAQTVKDKFGLAISSMQSIWYGRGENIFGTDGERDVLTEYTKKAVDFASALGCRNLVFGCPKNRNMPQGADIETAYVFFQTISAYAREHGTYISIEPNPVIYGTNYINKTEDAVSLARDIDGLMINIDTGTMIENGESVQLVADNIDIAGHIHISEPNLVNIKARDMHKELSAALKCCGYDKFISIEMKDSGSIEAVMQAADYVMEVFN